MRAFQWDINVDEKLISIVHDFEVQRLQRCNFSIDDKSFFISSFEAKSRICLIWWNKSPKVWKKFESTFKVSISSNWLSAHMPCGGYSIRLSNIETGARETYFTISKKCALNLWHDGTFKLFKDSLKWHQTSRKGHIVYSFTAFTVSSSKNLITLM